MKKKYLVGFGAGLLLIGMVSNVNSASVRVNLFRPLSTCIVVNQQTENMCVN